MGEKCCACQNVGWGILWFLGSIFVVWPFAWIIGGYLFILLLPCAGCFKPLENFLQGINDFMWLPCKWMQNSLAGAPVGCAGQCATCKCGDA